MHIIRIIKTNNKNNIQVKMAKERTLKDFQEKKAEKSAKAQKVIPKHKAEELAKKQRDIGVAEFFSRNRHLLGFDNKRKALMTTIKEAVDNALDACEEAGVLPEIQVEIVDMGNDRFRVTVEDNGPGIVKAQNSKNLCKIIIWKQISFPKAIQRTARYWNKCCSHVWPAYNRKTCKNNIKNRKR